MGILGRCLVKMADGSEKKVEDVQKGDCVWNGYVVRCVVKQDVKRVIRMVKFPLGLVTTAWHPAREQFGNSVLPPARLDEHGGILPYAHQGEDNNMHWKYPCLWLAKIDKLYVDCYYDFVLDTGHCIEVNGIQLVTLGHGFDGSIVGHTYYGTNAVLEDFKEKNPNGWEKGFVVFSQPKF